ncbi:hypothetical protein CMT42_15485 [Elizabethkingia anophelis]|uniref:Uncharacterized protein n=1 Tax=Elizabethkingia anophelis TaxID=1117645 RepID=A0A494J255_9FLAO|nr:hypothetical protein AYC66_18355 [Elizabethkingia anophelis]MDV3474564.1 hypothetical protein [Elizabethkingia anophelis]MDV3551038.1 hypothetical protein [Elizabethkingia anophelis]MDV3570134.1 hypothetical protein [Elizabethkingia anophelis]MDV3593844.1 hypothetical protein [Elizabethkingia anophelis]
MVILNTKKEKYYYNTIMKLKKLLEFSIKSIIIILFIFTFVVYKTETMKLKINQIKYNYLKKNEKKNYPKNKQLAEKLKSKK